MWTDCSASSPRSPAGCSPLAALWALGPAQATVITGAELAGYIRGDLRDYWLPQTARPDLWRRDIWVDLGMLTLARAQVTLRDGRLITKKEALTCSPARARQPWWSATSASAGTVRYGTGCLG
ncbi:MAG: hypothetical protein ACRDOI_40420 [Trebonia sp.]